MWYGVCKTTQINHKLYCSYNGTAHPLDNHGQELLQQYCPHLVHGANKTFTCCDEEQVKWAIHSFSSVMKYEIYWFQLDIDIYFNIN